MSHRYLIFFPDKPNPVAVTNWFDFENLYSEGAVVVDLALGRFCQDGVTWEDITEDHL